MRLRTVVIVLFLVSLFSSVVTAQSEADGLIAFASDGDGNGNRQIYIMNADGSGVEQLTNLDHYPLSPVWSPDGASLAFAVNEYEGYGSGTGKIYTMTASGARLREILEIEGNINNLDWSRDGESLLFTVLNLEGPSLYTVDPDGDNLEVIIDEQRVWYAKWSPDGEQIYASEYTFDGTIRLFSMNTNGGREREVPDLEPIQSPVDWTEDGELVLYVMDEDGAASLYIADEDFNRPERIVRHEVMPGSHASWSPDGKYIVFDHIDGGLYTVEIDSGDINPIYDKGYYSTPAWRPSGEFADDEEVVEADEEEVDEKEAPTDPLIVFINPDSRITTIASDGSNERELTPVGDYRSPRWSPDGSKIAYFFGDDPKGYYVMNRDGSDNAIVSKCLAYFCSGAIWSPDGNQIAFMESDAMSSLTINIIDLDSQDIEAITPDFFGFSYTDPAWSPDGSQLAFTYIDGAAEYLGVVDTASGEASRTGFGDESGIFRNGLIWLDNSRQIALGVAHGEIYLVNVRNGSVDTLALDVAGSVDQVFPDGSVRVLTGDSFITFSAAGKELSSIEVPGQSADLQPSGEFVGKAEVITTDEEETTDLSDYTEVYMVETCEIRAPRNVNMRRGPGTNFEQVGILNSGERAFADLQAREGTLLWWRLEGGGWVRWDIVQWEDDCQHLPREGDDPGEVLLVPDDREEAPDDAVMLRDGRGMISDRILDRGEIQIEYFCARQGLRAYRGKNNWACETGGDRVRLEIEDYDLICQQTYWNSFAFAIQSGRDDEPSLNWRCYELR